MCVRSSPASSTSRCSGSTARRSGRTSSFAGVRTAAGRCEPKLDPSGYRPLGHVPGWRGLGRLLGRRVSPGWTRSRSWSTAGREGRSPTRSAPSACARGGGSGRCRARGAGRRRRRARRGRGRHRRARGQPRVQRRPRRRADRVRPRRARRLDDGRHQPRRRRRSRPCAACATRSARPARCSRTAATCCSSGPPAIEFAATAGLAFENETWFVTERERLALVALKEGDTTGARGTVGAVARDARGRLAAATSTGGVSGQRLGRVGDSPLIGAGTWADDATVAVSCTGHGESIIRSALAHEVDALLRHRGCGLRGGVRAGDRGPRPLGRRRRADRRQRPRRGGRHVQLARDDARLARRGRARRHGHRARRGSLRLLGGLTTAEIARAF